MHQPFPTEPAARKAMAAQMKAAAPELMDDVAALRAAFPGARMTYFKAGELEVGQRPVEGHPVSDEILRKFERDERLKDAVLQESIRKEKARVAKSRSRSKKVLA